MIGPNANNPNEEDLLEAFLALPPAGQFSSLNDDILSVVVTFLRVRTEETSNLSLVSRRWCERIREHPQWKPIQYPCNLILAGDTNSGLKTLRTRLLWNLGGVCVNDRIRDRAIKRAEETVQSPFRTYKEMIREEYTRGIHIPITTFEFDTDRYHYTINDGPLGFRDFTKNVVTGSTQVDVCVLLCSADTSEDDDAPGATRSVESTPDARTREHARLMRLLGVRHLIVAVTKMDSAPTSAEASTINPTAPTAAAPSPYSEEKFLSVAAKMRKMLVEEGWGTSEEQIVQEIPIIPISALHGDNIGATCLPAPVKSGETINMPWWKGVRCRVSGHNPQPTVVTAGGDSTLDLVLVQSLQDALDKLVELPNRSALLRKPLRAPIGKVFTIKGIGTVVATRIDQGILRAGDKVKFLGCGESTPEGTVHRIERHHHERVDAWPGENIGFQLTGVKKDEIRTNGGAMVLSRDTTTLCLPVASFVVKGQVMRSTLGLLSPWAPPGSKSSEVTCIFQRFGGCSVACLLVSLFVVVATGDRNKENSGSTDNSDVLKKAQEGEILDGERLEAVNSSTKGDTVVMTFTPIKPSRLVLEAPTIVCCDLGESNRVLGHVTKVTHAK